MAYASFFALTQTRGRKTMCKFHKLILGILSSTAALSALLAGTSHAATTTANFQSKIIITATCSVSAGATLDFGSVSTVSDSLPVTGSNTINVNCTSGAPYFVGLDGGSSTGNTADRKLKLTTGTTTINYKLFQNSNQNIPWGDNRVAGGDAVSGTGTGSSFAHTVHGQVPVQTTPVPGTYTDTITVTVEY
jgi:spore coat protein U-like protein